MPRYYCDYCGTYLTHDSAPGRRQHMRGWKHRENVQQYYNQFRESFHMKRQQMMQHAMLMQMPPFIPTVPAPFPAMPPPMMAPRGPLPPGISTYFPQPAPSGEAPPTSTEQLDANSDHMAISSQLNSTHLSQPPPFLGPMPPVLGPNFGGMEPPPFLPTAPVSSNPPTNPPGGHDL